MATEHNVVDCATDWWGLADRDTLNDAAAIGNLNLFPPVIDRLQQGVLNTLFLGRLMLNPQGLRRRPRFQSGGRPVIDTSHLYYDGNSQGGIEGGLTDRGGARTSRRAVLGVSGMNYGNLLVQRSDRLRALRDDPVAAYPDHSLHPVILDLMQQLWDRGDPDGYAAQMTTHPLPDTPAHQVLMQIAYGDHQVTHVRGGGRGADDRRRGVPAGARPSTNRSRDTNLFYGLPDDHGRYRSRLGDRDLGQRPRARAAAAGGQPPAGEAPRQHRSARGPPRTPGRATAEVGLPAAQRGGRQRVRRPPCHTSVFTP